MEVEKWDNTSMKPEGMEGNMELRPSDSLVEQYSIEEPDEVKERTPQDIVSEVVEFLGKERSTDEVYIREAEGHLNTMRALLKLFTDETEHGHASNIIAELESLVNGGH
jgi:hypothetical protein